ncbi:uncharacterized protein [Apostichopus japonicus]|uniref:uncharacterized protein n=1 Tax=Stichopus japonicus TaxID=307972 RepID=UPI003AB34F43
MAELIRAIQSEDKVEIWKQLATSKESANYQSKTKRETPLFWASTKGYTDVVSNLLAKGANVESKTNWGATPLHAASEMGHLEVVKLLIAHRSPLNLQTQFGDTPAHLAAYRGQFEIVKFLVEAGSDIFIKNSERRTILDEASVAENAKIVRYLDGVVFGDDMKPTLWKTPYHEDPMVTTNLMHPNGTNSYPTSPQRKQPVCRSHSTPFTEHDKTTKERKGMLKNLKLRNRSFDEVVHHPTVRLRANNQTDDVLKYCGSRARHPGVDSLDSPNRRESGSLVDDVMHKNKHLITSSSRPRSDIPPASRQLTNARVGELAESARAQSLEKLVQELQCGLSYTQDELEKTKSELKMAKEEIDLLCRTQKNMKSQFSNNNNSDNRQASSNEKKRFILNINHK